MLLFFAFTSKAFSQDPKRYYTYKGAIKKYPITMVIRFYEEYECQRGGSLVDGYYYYDKSGKNHKLRLKGYACGASIYLTEKNKHGKVTGHFVGVIDDDEISGVWKNPKNNKQLDFKLKEIN